ncbi:MAG: diguanylate cyclase [Hydrogenoanaerobacterium sp.]
MKDDKSKRQCDICENLEKTVELQAFARDIDAALITCGLDSEYTINYASDGFYCLTGYGKHEFAVLYSCCFSKIIYDEDLLPLHDTLALQLEAGNATKNTYRINTKNNGIKWIFSRGVKNIDEDGNAFLKCILFDVTKERKELEKSENVKAELLASKKMYEYAVEYNNSMTSGKTYANEVNITRGIITDTNYEWLQKICMPDFKALDEMIEYMCINIIHPSYEAVFRNFFDKTAIEAWFNAGNTQRVAEYLRADGENTYRWVENTMNIIRDKTSGDIMARLYICTVDERKQKELRAQEEQHFYEIMVLNSASVYEANISLDTVLSGFSEWQEKFGIEMNHSYSYMIGQLAEQIVHPDDSVFVKKSFLRKNLILDFARGKHEIRLEFRRKEKSGDYVWRMCDIHLFEDPQTSEIKGFCYVKDINKQKLDELELHYKAEHDALTELYNKITTEKAVNAYLATEEGKRGMHAVLMFDIDYFKAVNDNLGHVIGDVVLSKIGRKTKIIFRNDDICGRVGGDEFLVLMKNIQSTDAVFEKARELQSGISESYVSEGRTHRISASIGISFYGVDGTDYKSLYAKADAALYFSKNSGRGRYCVYSKDCGTGGTDIMKVEDARLIESSSFDYNISSYIFKILYDSTDKLSAIASVLELLGRHYDVSRAYIFEKTFSGNIKNTFEWCDKGIMRKKSKLQSLSIGAIAAYQAMFNENGMMWLKDSDLRLKLVKKVLLRPDIIATIHFQFNSNNSFFGFLGFDRCRGNQRMFTQSDIDDMQNIAKVLGVFISEMRALALAESSKRTALATINAFESYSFVVDKNTYKCLFFNRKMKTEIPGMELGGCCYKLIFGLDSPCKNCGLESCDSGETTRRYIEKNNSWVEVSSHQLKWTNEENAILLIAKPL